MDKFPAEGGVKPRVLTDVDFFLGKQTLLPHEYLCLALNAPEKEPSRNAIRNYIPGGGKTPGANAGGKTPAPAEEEPPS